MAPPSYSARFVQSFAQVLSGYESFDAEALHELRAIDPTGRISMKVGNDLALQQVAKVGDADLGLKAARDAPLGRGGVLEYAMNSAATIRDAIDVAARFAHLFSDALTIRVDAQGRRVTVRLDSSVAAPRTIPDYAMVTWYSRHASLADGAALECLFQHPKPSRTIEYDRTFGRAALTFDAPFYGFSFDREYLEAPLPTSDPGLHLVLCEHASLLLDRLPERRDMIARVREIAKRELLSGNPTVGRAASALRMSTRTLASRLEREGTTFSRLLDHVRHELALSYLGDAGLSPTEIAFRLGFSHVEAFYRAFRRWTGQTPVAYRRASGIGAPASAPPRSLG